MSDFMRDHVVVIPVTIPKAKAKTRTHRDQSSAVVVHLNDLSWLIDALGDYTDLDQEDDPRLARLRKVIADY